MRRVKCNFIHLFERFEAFCCEMLICQSLDIDKQLTMIPNNFSCLSMTIFFFWTSSVLFSLAGLHVINPHLTEVKRRSQLATMNEFRHELTKCLVDASFLVFSGNNHLFPEIRLSAFLFKGITRFPLFFHQITLETEMFEKSAQNPAVKKPSKCSAPDN